jgi:hypothetical protein
MVCAWTTCCREFGVHWYTGCWWFYTVNIFGSWSTMKLLPGVVQSLMITYWKGVNESFITTKKSERFRSQKYILATCFACSKHLLSRCLWQALAVIFYRIWVKYRSHSEKTLTIWILACSWGTRGRSGPINHQLLSRGIIFGNSYHPVPPHCPVGYQHG